MRIFTIIGFIVMFFILFACGEQAYEGATGPTGPQGEQGIQGTPGSSYTPPSNRPKHHKPHSHYRCE